MSYTVKAIGDKITLGTHMVRLGSGIGGLSPTLEIRRNSDSKYLDFSATVPPYWISVGGTETIVLTERPWLTGLYVWEFDQGFYDTGAQEYTMIYRNNPPYRTVQMEIVSFETAGAQDIQRILAYMENDQDLIALASDHYYHKIYDENGRAGAVTIHEADIALNGNTEERTKIL